MVHLHGSILMEILISCTKLGSWIFLVMSAGGPQTFSVEFYRCLRFGLYLYELLNLTWIVYHNQDAHASCNQVYM